MMFSLEISPSLDWVLRSTQFIQCMCPDASICSSVSVGGLKLSGRDFRNLLHVQARVHMSVLLCFVTQSYARKEGHEGIEPFIA